MSDYENDLILITCASGRQATALIPHIYNAYKRVRLQVNSSASKHKLTKQYPNAEVIQVDMADQRDCERMLQDVTACYLVDPPFHPREATLGINVITAASTQNPPTLQHLLYSSVIFPHLSKLLNHDCKRHIEEHLIESGLSYTIIQPTHIMETLPLALLHNSPDPIYKANWDPNTKFSFVTTYDIAKAAAKILKEGKKHFFATYQLVSTPEPLSYTSAMEIVSKVLGKEIKVEQRSFKEATTEGIKIINGGKEPSRATREIGKRMFVYYDERGLVGNNNVLRWLLGREPLDYESWVRMRVGEIEKGL